MDFITFWGVGLSLLAELLKYFIWLLIAGILLIWVIIRALRPNVKTRIYHRVKWLVIATIIVLVLGSTVLFVRNPHLFTLNVTKRYQDQAYLKKAQNQKALEASRVAQYRQRAANLQFQVYLITDSTQYERGYLAIEAEAVGNGPYFNVDYSQTATNIVYKTTQFQTGQLKNRSKWPLSSNSDCGKTSYYCDQVGKDSAGDTVYKVRRNVTYSRDSLPRTDFFLVVKGTTSIVVECDYPLGSDPQIINFINYLQPVDATSIDVGAVGR
ncbi:MAG: hypothetical protein QG553_382 [Patescibacteria group bacterium]|nr:hypothetical protein [Patescibacteria group bacterium]